MAPSFSSEINASEMPRKRGDVCRSPPHKQYVRRENAGAVPTDHRKWRERPRRELVTGARCHRKETYASSSVSECFELFRKTKILAVIHRAIDHGGLSA